MRKREFIRWQRLDHLTCSPLALRFFALAVFSIALMSSGCAQKMGNQPTYRPLEESDFFKDGQSARHPPEGTVPRGFRTMSALDSNHFSSAIQADAQSRNVARMNAATPANAEIFPMTITATLLARGRERYEIYCSVCHGLGGYGDGMIVQRGYSQPPSFHTGDLRARPASHYYEVISKGFGAMPGYAVQVEPQDRWAIIAYIRALQLSQHAMLADAPPDAQQKLKSERQQ
jgi:mono/diheme cytochrome c family protein